MMDKKKILKAFKSDLKAAETLRKEHDGRIQVWKDEHDGKKYGNEQPGKSQIVSRDIKKQSEWQHASIIDPFVSSPDIVKCNPITWEDKKAAVQNELVLNTQFCRQFNRYNFMTKAAKVLDREGTVVVQCGWEYEDEEVETEVPQVEMTVLGPQIVGMTTMTETKIIKNQPTAKVCRNEDIYIDPTCMDNMDDCQFVIHRYETDLSTLRSDGRYKNLDKVAKSGVDSSNDYDYDSEDETEFRFEDDPRKKMVVYEYWGNYDVNDDGIVESVVCAWIGDVVIRLEDNPYPDGKPPFIVVPFNSVPFQMYGEANAEMIGDNQKVKTAIIRGMIDNFAQSNNGQKGIRKGALDGQNRKRFMSGKNFEFNGTPNDFYDGSYNQIPGSAFDMLGMMDANIESITGVKSFSGGITGTSLGQTATGARGALDATSTRRLNIVRNIAENMVKPLMRKWMSYNSEFLDDTEVMRITNDEFVEVQRDDLEGRVDIDIQVSTAEDNAAKAQELNFMLQTNAASMNPEESRMIRAEIAKLNKMPDLAKMIQEFQPTPDPMQQRIQELQIAKLEAEVFNEQAKGRENAVDVELKTAKTDLERAKVRSLGSKADLDDLNFLEKESGADHQKEMEKKNHDAMTKLGTEQMKANNKSKSVV